MSIHRGFVHQSYIQQQQQSDHEHQMPSHYFLQKKHETINISIVSSKMTVDDCAVLLG